MANKFEFQVVALDRFTKTFKDLNDRASKATRPLQATGRQFQALGKELHIDKVTKGFSALGRVSSSVASNLGLAAGPLESMLGLGAAGGIAGFAAGVATLTSRFADLGFNAGRTASLMNVSTRDLQRFQGAARLAGLPAEALTSSLNSLGTAMQDALYGRNQQALVMLNKLGVQIKKNADGTIDSVAGFNDLALAISKIGDPRVQAIVAKAFGMEQALPLIRQGPEAIKKLADEAERLGQVIDESGIQKANKFTESWNRLKVATGGELNVYGKAFSGPMIGLMDFLSKSSEIVVKADAKDRAESPSKQASSSDRKLSKSLLFGPSGVATTPTWTPPSDMASPVGMPPSMVKITLGTESNGKRYGKDGKLLTSPVGAQGEMQVMPNTNRDPGYGVRPAKDDTPDELARVGRDYLGAMFKHYGNDPAKAWAAYNAGPGALDRRIKDHGDEWLSWMPAETQNYVAKNMRALVGQGLPGGGNGNANGAGPAAPAGAQQPVRVEVAFANAPPGTTAKTRNSSTEAFMPARVSYSMPTEVSP